MQTFKDALDGVWLFSVNVATVEQVRSELQIDLLEYGMQDDSEDLTQVLQFQVRADPILLCRIVYHLVKATAEAAGDTFECSYMSFASAMHGDFLWSTIAKLETEIVNFTLSPELRVAKRKAVQKMADVIDKTHRIARETMEATLLDPRIDAMHDRVLGELVAQSGERLESLASTPDPSPSES